jgi:hypothetical protein
MAQVDHLVEAAAEEVGRVTHREKLPENRAWQGRNWEKSYPEKALKQFNINELQIFPGRLLNIIETAARLQRLFLQRGILLRGGIAFGKHYATSNVMFSQALVSAYGIESRMARFPRIVIDSDALNFAWHHEFSNEELHGRIRNLVLIDRDGAPFVNYLSAEALNSLTPHIRACIETNTQPDETVLEKMRWLLDYQNYSSGVHGFERLDLQHFANGFSYPSLHFRYWKILLPGRLGEE